MARLETAAPAEQSENRQRARWIARLGVVGFTFFLVKGLLWLIIPGMIAIGWMR